MAKLAALKHHPPRMRSSSFRRVMLCAALTTACGKPELAPPTKPEPVVAAPSKRVEPVVEHHPKQVGAPVVFGNLGARHTGRVEAVAFSPDGSRFVSVGGESMLEPTDVIVWETSSGERVAQTTAMVSSVAAYYDDGVRLFDEALMVWRPGEDKRELGRLDGYPIYGSDDGAWIYAGGSSPTPIMNAATGRISSVPGFEVVGLWVSGDRMFAQDQDGKLHVGPLGEATRAVDLEGDTLLGVHPDGKRVAVLTETNVIRVRELDGVRLGSSVDIRLEDLVDERDKIELGYVRWSPDGRYLALDIREFANGFMLVVDVPRRRLAGRIVDELGNYITSLAFSVDSKRLAYGTKYGRVRVWDAETDALVYRATGHLGTVWDVELSADGRTIASFGDETTRVHDFAEPIQETAYGDHEHWVTAGALTPDGSRVVSCSDYGDVNVRALPGGALLARYEAQDCLELELHGELGYVLTGEGVKAFDLNRGAEIASWEVADLSQWGGLHMALSPAGDRIALLGDRGVELRELPSGRVLWRRDWGRTVDLSNEGIAFAPSGDELFVADERLHRIDARTGEDLVARDYEGGRITAAGYCGARPIIGTSDGTLAILDDALAPTLRWSYPDGGVYSLAANPDLVVAGGSDGRVYAWPLIIEHD